MTDLSPLEAALANTEPMTEEEIGKSLRLISRRAWDASREHAQVCRDLGDTSALAEETYWTALLGSQEHKRTVGHHEAIARHAALEPAARAKSLTLMERSLRVELGVLEKLVSALQSQLKSLRVDA